MDRTHIIMLVVCFQENVVVLARRYTVVQMYSRHVTKNKRSSEIVNSSQSTATGQQRYESSCNPIGLVVS
jgi:hypothetical protein